MTIHECHLNPYAARRILWTGDRALIPLQPLCCTYSQAADLIADNITNVLHGPTGSPPHDPFHRLKQNWNASNLSDLPRIIKSPWLKGKKEQDLLDLYFEYFNNMIFGGALNALRCTMKLEEPSAEQRDRGVLGTTVDRRLEKDTTRHNVRCHISVFLRHPAPKTEAESVVLLKNYLGTMLHEMVHAFLVFMFAARSIERFVRYGLRLDLRLGREEALGLELIIGDKEIWYVDLKKMGMDREVVNREMDWYAQIFIDELEARRIVEKEKEDQLEKLEQERLEREEKERKAREKWEKERPEREAKEKKLLKEARRHLLKDLRNKSIRAGWSIFKRRPKSILKPHPPPTLHPEDEHPPPPPPHDQPPTSCSPVDPPPTQTVVKPPANNLDPSYPHTHISIDTSTPTRVAE